MKHLIPLLWLLLVACNANDAGRDAMTDRDTSHGNMVDEGPAPGDLRVDSVYRKTYANQRFRDVKVERVNDSTFRITGQAQIFEARFSWVIEDGHRELAEGYESTSAGAPAWGKFSFKVNAQKERPQSTLHLILFEASAKDGSRQHQLPIPL